MKKNISIAIAILIILVLGIWYSRSVPPVSAPTVGGTTEVTTEVINKDIQNINVGDLDKDFDAVNKNINTL